MGWRVSLPLLCEAVLERWVPLDVWCEGPCVLPWRSGVAIHCWRAWSAYARREDLGGVQDDTRGESFLLVPLALATCGSFLVMDTETALLITVGPIRIPAVCSQVRRA